MAGAFLITLREALEAALIIGIVLGYLAKIGQTRWTSHVWVGTGLAVLASAATAYLFERLVGGFEGRSEEIFEGVVMLIAVVVLTSMILWMQRQARQIKGELQHRIDATLASGQVWGLSALAFFAVYREGVETVLFLKAAVLAGGTGGALVGGLLGILLAVAIAYLLFRTSVSFNLRQFFLITGSVLVLFAAGLLAHGIHELQEAGVVPVIIEHLWDMNGILDEKGPVGSFLKALFGYNGNPSLLEVVAWLAYLTTFGRRYLGEIRGGRKVRGKAAA